MSGTRKTERLERLTTVIARRDAATGPAGAAADEGQRQRQNAKEQGGCKHPAVADAGQDLAPGDGGDRRHGARSLSMSLPPLPPKRA